MRRQPPIGCCSFFVLLIHQRLTHSFHKVAAAGGVRSDDLFSERAVSELLAATVARVSSVSRRRGESA